MFNTLLLVGVLIGIVAIEGKGVTSTSSSHVALDCLQLVAVIIYICDVIIVGLNIGITNSEPFYINMVEAVMLLAYLVLAMSELASDLGDEVEDRS
mgnify:FL=1